MSPSEKESPPSGNNPPQNASQFRTKHRVLIVMRYLRDKIYDELPPSGSKTNQLRKASEILADNISVYTKEKGRRAVGKTAFRERLFDLPMNHVETCRDYITDMVNPLLSFRLTGLIPLPYEEDEMVGLRRGHWCLIKRSHTKKGEFSLSAVHIDQEKHDFGSLWHYKFEKKTEDALNIVNGYIGQSHGQYLFFGAEKYKPAEGQTTYSGTQIISVGVKKTDELDGIVLNAVDGRRRIAPCAAKIIMVYTKTDCKDHTGLYSEKDIRDKAKELGIKKFRLPNDEPCPDWNLLVAY